MPGHVVKRYKGSYSVVVDLGRDPATGKRRQLWRSVKGTKKQADELLVQLLHERDSGVDRPIGKLTVAAFLERWITDYVEPSLAPKTAQTYREIIRRRFVPTFGALELTALRPPQIQAWYTKLQTSGRADGSGGLAAKSVLRYHQVLHAALRQAVRWQLLPRNPADAVEPPRAARRELLALTAAQVTQIVDAAEAEAAPCGAIVRVAVLTGMRRGELLGLRWRDVDLDAGQAHVQQTAQRVKTDDEDGQKSTIVFRQPKTRLSRRSIALSPETVALLRRVRRSQVEARLLAGSAYQDRDLVFASAVGTAVEAGTLARVWRRIVAAAGVGHVRFHDLRHAHATLLLQQGVHPKIVSERLGHASIAITLDTYSHVLPGMQAAAAAGLDMLLAEAHSEDALAIR